MYPVDLVRAILEGISLQAKEDSLKTDPLPVCPMPMHTPAVAQEGFGPPTHSSGPWFGKKGTVPITYEEQNFKSRYLDEYTGETLAPHLIRPAIEDELN